MIGIALGMALQVAALPQTDSDEGRAVVECSVGRCGAVSNCRVVETTHPGREMEGAAIQSVQRGRLAPQPGVKEGDKFRVTVNLRVEQ